MRVQLEFKMATDGVQTYHYHGFGILSENTLRFIDRDKDHYEFCFSDSKNITMNRLGQSPLKMTFVKNTKSSANITQDGYSLSLEVLTTELIVEKNRIDIIYQITDGESIFSKHHLVMDWNHQWKE